MGSELHITESAGFEKPARVTRNEITGEIVIHGVRYLGAVSANEDEGVHNEYPLEGRIASESCYDGAAVMTDHPDRDTPGAERSIREKIGRLRGPFQHLEGGSHANLHINPHHPLAEQVAWSAQHSPDDLGLSHNAIGDGVVEGKSNARKVTVKAVRSVDLVNQPATANSLFESRQEAPMADPETTDAPEAVETQESAPAAPAPTPEPEAPTVDVDALEALQAEIAELKAQAAERERVTAREKLIAESKLPEDVLSTIFVEQVVAATDEATAKALIEDRRRVAFHQDPAAAAAGSPPKPKASTEFEAWIESL